MPAIGLWRGAGSACVASGSCGGWRGCVRDRERVSGAGRTGECGTRAPEAGACVGRMLERVDDAGGAQERWRVREADGARVGRGVRARMGDGE